MIAMNEKRAVEWSSTSFRRDLFPRISDNRFRSLVLVLDLVLVLEFCCLPGSTRI
jgi:hypothetical protein